MYKRIDFTKLNGLPIYQESLDFLQKSYRDSLKGIAEGLGNNVIVSGATVSGPNYTDGWVILGGELMPFTGGAIQTNVVVQENIETETFEGGNIEHVYYTKRAVLASSGGVPFASLERMRSVEVVNDMLNAIEVYSTGTTEYVDSPSSSFIHWKYSKQGRFHSLNVTTTGGNISNVTGGDTVNLEIPYTGATGLLALTNSWNQAETETVLGFSQPFLRVARIYNISSQLYIQMFLLTNSVANFTWVD
jgi:hypothetical protein